ncbi:glycosyltransferase family 4 protein [Chryseobacterium sp. 09-1422]|uniref:Glycosyltransferase family 4 protein n=1 Tax=Chryseobacterium kimseyorum TaxID=2984028 RepID=A0ABT3I4F8_9FLAO|nr:glycosyltransferase family 4 protein [Chryseobacterium kimseyorum]MCW3170795.1 glycosyltransferase family 4 protein [Chryseobacterium kimseyorum]
MKIVFLSTFALDANVSIVNALKKKCDVYFFTEALYEIYNFLNKDQLNKTISEGTEVNELQLFRDLLALEKTYVVKGTRNANIFKKLYNSYRVHQYIKKINPDFIIIDNYMLTYFLSTLAYRKKMLMIVHDPFLHSGEDFVIDSFLRKIHFKLIKNKILLNESQRNDFIEYYKECAQNVSSSFLSVYDYLTCFKIRETVQTDNFNILFFGRISPYKGIKYLLDAFLKILAESNYENLTLTIAGSGDFDFDINEYKKYPRIKIINTYISPGNLAQLISESSVVVCPYTDATQSGVIMSAYAFKKPVIATDVGGLPEMVEHNKTGLIIKPRSSEAIYQAILELHNDKELIERMAENIENIYFSGEKSWDASAALFIDALQKIERQSE